MEHLIKPRQLGKTWKCVEMSAETGAVIVCKSECSLRYIKEIAETRGLNIPTPYTAMQLLANPNIIDHDKELIIDDADLVLIEIFKHNINTISMTSRNSDGTEEVPFYLK